MKTSGSDARRGVLCMISLKSKSLSVCRLINGIMGGIWRAATSSVAAHIDGATSGTSSGSCGDWHRTGSVFISSPSLSVRSMPGSERARAVGDDGNDAWSCRMDSRTPCEHLRGKAVARAEGEATGVET